ncbi:4-(cytidine 5'-diphospho)-2-C-methyl-D-erythritol kinase [Bacteroidota bacterium]
MIFFPNAKINIGLFVKKKLPDGFHEIESIMIPVALCDLLEVVVNESDEFKLTTSGISIESEIEKNLCYKAWKIVNSRYEIPGVQMHLHKNIPVGAGLGGGSSDAAYTLKLLNHYFELKIGEEELMVMAGEIGNDCPFFISNKISFAYNKGQLLKPLELDLKLYHVVIVFPNMNISTRWAYQSIIPERKSESLFNLISLPIDQWKERIYNDFESVVFAEYPEIEKIKEVLYSQGAVYASLSGSGSVVYGIFNEFPVLKNDFEPYFTWQGRITA